ncbi:hypothetical protein [Natranaerobius thermophilus]|uniref:Uncharacterized protein n=1 Tax=Natranaerobius thermophilus (strain ATCC BAA-1301 / DSM 18059 / JW/NM-WN-LF) TaxID=457570 RepID=B2A166_NATTJ|nr:hypothetical protein [Natranaerobius thermophilus]ACB86007.1 hypothetical protein Nther_2442 [Natranaerobius thermophilus JW/NM-WN-LF]
MGIFFQGIIFFVFFLIAWYILKIKNIWGLGVNVESKKEAFFDSLLTAVVAAAIFVALNLLI